jgi:signal transduction histidine kinase
MSSTLGRAIAIGMSPQELLDELRLQILAATGSPRGALLQRASSVACYRGVWGDWLRGSNICGDETDRLDSFARGRAVIADLRTVPTLSEGLAASRGLIVPITGRWQWILVLGDPSVSDEQALAIASTAAGEFAVALEWERLAREHSIQQRLRDISLAFPGTSPSPLSFMTALGTIVTDANEIAGAHATAVWLYDRRSRELTLVASTRPAADLARRCSAEDPLAPAARGLRLDAPKILTSESAPILVAPLRGWRRALGTIVFDRPDPALDDERLIAVASDLSRQVSVALESAQLLDEVLLQHRLLENTFNSLVDLVAVTGNDLRVVRINQAFAARAGRTPAELSERPLGELIGPELRTWLEDTDRRGAEPALTSLPRTRVFEDATLGGTFVVTFAPLVTGTNELSGRVLVARDVTVQARLESEREALREQLAESERLASLGQFVAGIAHEMNNPLQGVLGHLELLMTTSADARPLRKELRHIYREADRAAKIVRNLLVFAGDRPMAKRRVNVDRVLARVLSSRRAALTRKGIDVAHRSSAGTPWISGDPLLLQQAFLNLLINAEHAITAVASAGKIEIATSAARGEAGVVITIRDSGPGIPPDVLPRIFDPFFTTKDAGQGTGLGLAITYGIVQEHGGSIQARNCPDGGAMFTVELPGNETAAQADE